MAHTHIHRGRSRFCGAWSLYNLWGLIEKKNIKLQIQN